MPKRPLLPHGPVPLAPEVAALLSRTATHLKRPLTWTLDPELIESVEEPLNSVIPNEVLAVLAIERRSPGLLLELTDSIREFYAANERGLAKQLGFDHVAFAMVDGTSGEWDAEPRFAVFRRTLDRVAPAEIVLWDLRKPDVGGHRWTLARYLDEAWEIGTRVVDQRDGAFELSIVSTVKVERYAEHKKFGRGRELSRGDGKVTLQFADGATRTFAEAFVTPVGGR